MAILRDFSGGGNPYPLAIFRLIFYFGLSLHFAPVLLEFEDNFGVRAFRMGGFSDALFSLPENARVPLARALGALAVLGLVGATIAWKPRLCALVVYLSLYALTSINSFNVHTLALQNAWAVLGIFSILGGGDEVLSIRRSRGGPPTSSGRSRLVGVLLCALFVGTLFFSGVEKVVVGWPFHGALARLLRYPDHGILRPWVVGAFAGKTNLPGYVLEWTTLAIELAMPVAVAIPRLRTAAVAMYGLFFVGITAVLEIPLLFSALYLGCIPLLMEHTRSAGSRATAPSQEREAEQQ